MVETWHVLAIPQRVLAGPDTPWRDLLCPETEILFCQMSIMCWTLSCCNLSQMDFWVTPLQSNEAQQPILSP